MVELNDAAREHEGVVVGQRRHAGAESDMFGAFGGGRDEHVGRGDDRPSNHDEVGAAGDGFRRGHCSFLIVIIAAALTILILFLNLSSHDVPTMIELLVSSAVISLGVGALFVWVSSDRQWNRLTTRRRTRSRPASR